MFKVFPSGVALNTDDIKFVDYREMMFACNRQACIFAQLKSGGDEVWLAFLDSVDAAKKYIAELTDEINGIEKDEGRRETIFGITLDDRTKTLRTTNGGEVSVKFDKIVAFFVAGVDDVKISLLCAGGVVVDICDFRSAWIHINSDNAKKVVDTLQSFLHFSKFANGNVCLNPKYKFEYDVVVSPLHLKKYVVCRYENFSITIKVFDNLADALEYRAAMEMERNYNETNRN